MQTHLTATIVAAPDDVPEAEGIIVDTDADVVLLRLPDGATVEFDRVELHTATAPPLAA